MKKAAPAPPKKLLPPSEILKRLMETDDPFFITAEEAALFLRRTVRTIRTYLDEGTQFPGARKVNDGWLIPAVDLRVLLSVPPLHPEKPASPPASTPSVRRRGFVRNW